MGKRSRRISPEGDYISDGRGGYETTTTAETSIYLQLRTALGAWVGAPDRGSRLHEFARAKSLTGTTAVQLKEAILAALQPLIDAGRIRNPSVRVERDQNRIVTDVTITDAQTGKLLNLSELVRARP